VLSRSSEYAVRALSYLAIRRGGDYLQTREIAAELALPAQYLSKVLRRLAEVGLLASQRGRTGGFRLEREAAQISLLDIVLPFEPSLTGLRCVLGQSLCSDQDACPLHGSWTAVRSRFYDVLEGTSLADVARRAVRRGSFPRAGLDAALPVGTAGSDPS